MIYNDFEEYERVGEVVWNMRGEPKAAASVSQAATALSAASQPGAACSAASAAATSPAAAVAPATMLHSDHTQVCIPFGAESLARARFLPRPASNEGG